MRANHNRPFFRNAIIAAFFALLIAGITRAQDRPSAGHVNIEFSRVYIFVDKVGAVGHQHAIEGKLSNGNLFPSGKCHGDLTFDMQSFEADTVRAQTYIGLEGTTDESTRKKVNENMLGSEILNVKKFSTAKFERVSIQPKQTLSKRQLPEYLLAGDFTLHEKTRPVEILCDLEVKDGWNHLRGTFKILQSNYGIKRFSKMFGTIGVTDELTIYGDLWIVPE
jgi:polyisoprenoid-binding protein YceI